MLRIARDGHSHVTRDSPPLHFLPYTIFHLCYDGIRHQHGGRAPGREETGGLCRGGGSGDRPPRQRGRLTYRTLTVQFQLDDAALEALKDELIEAQPGAG